MLLTVGVGKHTEKLWCAVTCLGKVPLILGHDLLKKHNPDIDWTTGDIKLSQSSNGEPLGAGLHTICTTIHEGCARLSIGLCTVHDIIVEPGG